MFIPSGEGYIDCTYSDVILPVIELEDGELDIEGSRSISFFILFEKLSIGKNKFLLGPSLGVFRLVFVLKLGETSFASATMFTCVVLA